MLSSIVGYFKSKRYTCIDAFFLDENNREKKLFTRLVPKSIVNYYAAPGEGRFYVKLVMPRPNYRVYANTPVWRKDVNGFEEAMFLY